MYVCATWKRRSRRSKRGTRRKSDRKCGLRRMLSSKLSHLGAETSRDQTPHLNQTSNPFGTSHLDDLVWLFRHKKEYVMMYYGRRRRCTRRNPRVGSVGRYRRRGDECRGFSWIDTTSRSYIFTDFSIFGYRR